MVVDENTWTNELEEVKAQYKGVDKGFHFGSHPDVFGNLAETDYFNDLDKQQNLSDGEATLEKARKDQPTPAPVKQSDS
jgi:hypothetical protein